MSNLQSGLFINLYDEDTLQLYLDNNIYGFLMTYQTKISPQSRHFQALADYACTREGTHVFFFLKRKIIYGGTIVGNSHLGSFYLNGVNSPLGRLNNASLFWDESTRYSPLSNEGVFNVNEKAKSQPYLIMFKDDLNLKGQFIVSDELYFELGKFGYPLPSNSVSNMGFCTLTPGETEIALKLITNSKNNIINYDYKEKDANYRNNHINPLLFNGLLGFNSINQAINQKEIINEAHIEASLLANPELFPEPIRPKNTDVLCRQIPISPFKPENMDRADICIYEENTISKGTVPNHIIELKKDKANKNVIFQVQRYLRWIKLILEDKPKLYNLVKVSVLAPSYTNNIHNYVDEEFKDKISLYDYEGNLYQSINLFNF